MSKGGGHSDTEVAASKPPGAFLICIKGIILASLLRKAVGKSEAPLLCLVAQSCSALCDSMDCSLPGSFVHGDSPGKKNEVGCHAVFQGIFPTQGSNPGLPYCRRILYHLSYQGSPRILEWVVYPFFRGSFLPRNQTRVSCIAGYCFTS